jgi:hypothetical protein
MARVQHDGASKGAFKYFIDVLSTREKSGMPILSAYFEAIQAPSPYPIPEW